MSALAKFGADASPASSTHEKKRVQFDFSIEAARKLDELKTRTGAASSAEVVRNALRLYDWFITKRDEKARVFVSTDEDNMREVELMF